ncbi:PQQ-dependent sugar dehydrogenase [Gilvimarinus sp. F26214L]|uniref:PQQ-dependent sugar dehydrogenase n=1 Tax=Gilvimarinus sp. DZF01 TaxID=3461371 RepID=UPI00404543E9
MRFHLLFILPLALLSGLPAIAQSQNADPPFNAEELADFEQPWAMTFLPDGAALITEMKGELLLFREGAEPQQIEGVPEVAFGGQGGLGDVALHPDFANNQVIYISYAEPGEGDTRGAAVARARLAVAEDGGALEDLEVIWRQEPKVSGEGHYSHRLLFGPDGHLWVTSGDRQKLDPAQDKSANLGKILRLNDDGSVPDDNPFASEGEVAAQIWTLGHRNMLGIVFDDQGRLWAHEMGPQGGDELNLIEKGENYGWPVVSEGIHYDGTDIPDHSTRPEFKAPVTTWTPVISPAGFIIYSGEEFPDWKGSALVGGLSSQSLVRIEFQGDGAEEAERFNMGDRIREVEQAPDGTVWLLEDGRQGGAGRLLKLSASRAVADTRER